MGDNFEIYPPSGRIKEKAKQVLRVWGDLVGREMEVGTSKKKIFAQIIKSGGENTGGIYKLGLKQHFTFPKPYRVKGGTEGG